MITKNVPPLAMEQLKRATKDVRLGKAPGQGRIPPEAVKIGTTVCPETWLGILNQLLNKQEFRKGKSTVEAINTIIEAVRSFRKKRIALVSVDVKNAFISATWSIILRELYKWNI